MAEQGMGNETGNAVAGDDIPEHVKEFNHYAQLAREGFNVPPGPWGHPKPQPKQKRKWWRRGE